MKGNKTQVQIANNMVTFGTPLKVDELHSKKIFKKFEKLQKKKD